MKYASESIHLASLNEWSNITNNLVDREPSNSDLVISVSLLEYHADDSIKFGWKIKIYHHNSIITMIYLCRYFSLQYGHIKPGVHLKLSISDKPLHSIAGNSLSIDSLYFTMPVTFITASDILYVTQTWSNMFLT